VLEGLEFPNFYCVFNTVMMQIQHTGVTIKSHHYPLLWHNSCEIQNNFYCYLKDIENNEELLLPRIGDRFILHQTVTYSIRYSIRNGRVECYILEIHLEKEKIKRWSCRYRLRR